jgi:hypothetical protein
MTISTTARVAGPFIGAGTTATFPFTFKVFTAADLLVATLNTASGEVEDLTLVTDYSVVLNGDQNTNPGGSITLTAGNLAVGLTLSITTDIPEEQSLNLVSGGGFFPEVINDALDKLTILVQQIAATLGRTVKVDFGDSSDMSLPAPALRANKLLMFDGNGNITLATVASGSIVPGAQTAAGLVNSANKDFTFTAAAGPTPSIIVFAGGVFQDPSSDYGAPVFVSGTTWKITFTSAPANGPIKVLMLG